MYLVTNCVSSANCLIILEQLENLISSLDESPAHISNKLPQARQRRFYPSHQISAVQDTLLNLSKGKKKACVCVWFWDGMHAEKSGVTVYICACCHSGFPAPVCRELWSPIGTKKLNFLSSDHQLTCSFWIWKRPSKRHYYRSKFTFLQTATLILSCQVAPCRLLMQRTNVTSSNPNESPLGERPSCT